MSHFRIPRCSSCTGRLTHPPTQCDGHLRSLRPLPRRSLRQRNAVRPAAEDHRRPTRRGVLAGARGSAEAARRAGKWLAGYFSYEAGYLLEPKLAPPSCPKDRRTPLICLGVFDAPSRSTPMPSAEPHADQRADLRRQGDLVVRGLQAAIRPRCTSICAPATATRRNLTFPIRGAMDRRSAAAFDALIARQPVKYGALVDLGGPVILSRSPELFFEIDERRLDRDASDEGHGAARRDAGGGRASSRERLRNDPEEPGRKPHDRRSAAQRYFAASPRSARSTCRSSSASKPIRPCTRW